MHFGTCIPLCVLLLATSWVAVARAVPAPPPRIRPITTSTLTGHWKMDWAGSRYDVLLSADGMYLAIMRGSGGVEAATWEGSWSVQDGVLSISETISSASWQAGPGQAARLPPSPYVWRVRLEREGTGFSGRLLDSGGGPGSTHIRLRR